ncbi:MAG TPA: carboxypeptidase-like regulatory domain-containing protein [Thermoanaerobaculia bacterium]|nr:carboxypeptidase-like regulatory domain-containing protein [Thermoanaerobaculia bacterium]
MIRRLALIPVLLAASGCFFLPYGDVFYSFGGIVSDPAGRPIAEAKVEILLDGKHPGELSVALTDAEGKYLFFERACKCDRDFEVVASKEGFERYSKKMGSRAAARLRRQDIVLKSLNDQISYSPPG